MGSGAYGVVISALNVETGRKVAIKKVPRAFENIVDAKRILREIKLLRQFEHENIINIVDILPPLGSLANWEDLYIVNDLMETDLHRIIYSNQPLSIDHCQYFVYQILRALKYMHGAHVVHRDLKPSNLLLNGNCDLKVCDLGLSRGIDGDDTDLTEYVVTRWYRAPEIMLACQEYTEAIDVWSVGCIFGELLERQPLFPGEDYIDQIRRIVAKLGKPAPEELDFVTSEKARRFILGLPEPPATSHASTAAQCVSGERSPQRQRKRALAWREGYKKIDPLAVDLLERMLVFRPADRISVVEALKHPFMAQLHVESDEPKASFTFDWAYEQAQDISKANMQRLVWDEMAFFRPECAVLKDPTTEWDGYEKSLGRGQRTTVSSSTSCASTSSSIRGTQFSPLDKGACVAKAGPASPLCDAKGASPVSERSPRTRRRRARESEQANLAAQVKVGVRRSSRSNKDSGDEKEENEIDAKEVAAAISAVAMSSSSSEPKTRNRKAAVTTQVKP